MEMFSLRLREWIRDFSAHLLYSMAHSGLFVQPRYARFLNKSAILERMGAPIPVTESPRRAPEEAASLSRVPMPAAQESS